jgi:hypothetical protein
MHLFAFVTTVVLAAGLGAFAEDVSQSDVAKAFKDANVCISIVPSDNTMAWTYDDHRDLDKQIPVDLSIKFDPRALLDVTFPQESGNPITLKAGVQLPRNGVSLIIYLNLR